MKIFSNKILSVLLSAMFAFSVLSLLTENAFAAQSEKSGSVSKGTTAIIMIAIFIITAVCTAFITFKIRKKKSDSSSELTSHEEKEK